MRLDLYGVTRVRFAHAVGVEHGFRSQSAPSQRDRRRTVRLQFVSEPERHAEHCRLPPFRRAGNRGSYSYRRHLVTALREFLFILARRATLSRVPVMCVVIAPFSSR